MNPRTFTAKGSGTGLDTTYAGNRITLAMDATDTRTENVPRRSVLHGIKLAYANRAGGAANLTFYLTRDAAGNEPVSDEVTVTAIPGQTTAAAGGNYKLFITPLILHSSIDALYLWAKWDVGTGDVTAELYGLHAAGK